MNLHEHQAKALLRDYGIPMTDGINVETPAEAASAAQSLGGDSWAVKAQIHAGLRQKAGGVRMVSSPEEARTTAAKLLGSRLVTPQTGPEGKTVKSVYIERAVGYDRQVYLAALVDRSAGRVALIAAKAGGDDIEDWVAEDPSRLLRLVVDPDQGVEREAALALAKGLGLEDSQAKQAGEIMAATYKAFMELDASLIEFNPLVVTTAGDLLALDAKIVLDDNALFRHQDLEALRDEDEVDPTELEAKRFELNYVKLTGNIGVMVNGAGLALSTIDLLKAEGGEPADFMDVRPEATRDQIAGGFGLLLRNPKVEAILVNIYGGGILRCDTVAEGIGAAWRERGSNVPLIVRAAGTNGDLARKILASQGIPVDFADTLGEAVAKVVQAAKARAG
ncbi:MAG: ADP-forming succinate--CoA ligase subunit beta [Kiloniellales bacterium]|nr:ADP-forming succinate--CoA ligase subunit beta [Kiloniellales bacterium]